MSDPRYPSAFQRPTGEPSDERRAQTAPPTIRRPRPSTGSERPRAQVRPPAVDVPADDAPSSRSGNRIVLLGGDGADAPQAPEPTRNLAIGGLYAIGAALLLLGLLGGMWGQGLLRRVEYGGFGFSPGLNPDELWEFTSTAATDTAAGLARLLVQLAPTTLALGVLALLAAIVLPILTRRPR